MPQEATIRSHRLSEDESSPASASSSHSTGSVKIRHRQDDDVQVRCGYDMCAAAVLHFMPLGSSSAWPARGCGHH